jgi:hypothetical protein
VSILTLLFLLTGTAYPIPGWWTRYGSHSLDVLKIAENIYHPPSSINYSTTHALSSVSYAESARVFARRGRGDIIAPPTAMSRPSTNGPVSLVDNNVRANWQSACATTRGRFSFAAVFLMLSRSFPSWSRSASRTYHVMHDVRSPQGSRSPDASNPQAKPRESSCGP